MAADPAMFVTPIEGDFSLTGCGKLAGSLR